MQPRVTAVRSSLTDAQVVALLQDAPALTLSAGMDLVDINLQVLADLSGDLAGGEVRRNSYASLHGSGSFSITRVLDWGSAMVRPYMTVTDGAVTARFNLGVYLTNTPEYDASESPPTFAVEASDILFRLAQPVGEAYSINAGDAYLTIVEQILVGRGYSKFVIDQEEAAKLAPTARVWAFADNNTWLTVVNDLLASIGYAGIWSDWDGYLRCDKYILPQERTVEWTYTDNPDTTMLSVNRVVQYDFHSAPNRWVVYRSNNVDDVAPVEGNGIYTYTNQSVGVTSVDRRGGLIITRVEAVDAADHASLVAQAEAIIKSDMDVPTVIHVETSPNPLHWHFDRLFVQDSGSIPAGDVQCTEWTLPLPPNLGDMTQTWRPVSL